VERNHRRINHRMIELEMECGKGTVSGQGSDPQIMLRYSDDGGYVWSSEDWRGVGALGNYQTVVRWRNRGQSRERIYEVVMTDPVPMTLIRADGQFEICDY